MKQLDSIGHLLWSLTSRPFMCQSDELTLLELERDPWLFLFWNSIKIEDNVERLRDDALHFSVFVWQCFAPNFWMRTFKDLKKSRISFEFKSSQPITLAHNCHSGVSCVIYLVGHQKQRGYCVLHSGGSEVQNIWFLSHLVPSKREKNIQTETVCLSLYIFWGKCVYFSIFEW